MSVPFIFPFIPAVKRPELRLGPLGIFPSLVALCPGRVWRSIISDPMSIRAQPGRQMILVHFEQKMKS